MSNNINKYLNAELVLVSDVHLRNPGDPRSQLMDDLLAAAADSKPANFVLLGDVFDFCLGTRSYFRKKFTTFGRGLETLARGGTRVIFFEGNHEFHLPAIGWQGVEFVPEGSMTLPLGASMRLRMAHGDLIYAPKAYLWFRGLVKSRFAHFMSRFVPMGWLDKYALGHSKVSRAQDKYRVLDHVALLAAADAWIKADQATHGVFGHFHVPYGEQRPADDGLIMSVDAWDRPNALIYTSERGFERIFWGERGINDFVVKPLSSFLIS